METKFKFNSQVCTDKNQSERLLALGLKKETSDMMYEGKLLGEIARIMPHETEMNRFKLWDSIIPAWSLARILELMPESIDYKNNTLYLTIYGGDVFYTNWQEHTPLERTLDVYEHLISYIEWLIKEGYFNKEYLEE